MTFADFKTEINNTPVMLKIASLMYIIPALALFYYYVISMGVDSACFFSIIFMLMGIGLYKKNIGAWWVAVILPFLITGFGIFLFICWLDDDSWLRDFVLIEAIFFVAIGLYFALVAFLITRPKIKILFKKAVKEKGV